MTRIDFYVLQEKTAEARLNFTCKLAEKAARHHNKVMIWVADEAMQKSLDKMLWAFRPESFLPHTCIPGANTDPNPLSQTSTGSTGAKYKAGLPEIVISHNCDSSDQQDVLINLTASLPPMFSRFQRMAEIVIQQDAVLSQSRSRYSQLKEKGYTINMHKL